MSPSGRGRKLAHRLTEIYLPNSLAIVLYFVIPRAPTFQLSADTPLTADNDVIANFTRTPAQMQWQAQLNVAIDTKANWIPVGANRIRKTAVDKAH